MLRTAFVCSSSQLAEDAPTFAHADNSWRAASPFPPHPFPPPSHHAHARQNDHPTRPDRPAPPRREEVQRALGPNDRALIAASTGPDASPFGPTYVYGYPSVAFEVLRSGRVAAATLFESPAELIPGGGGAAGAGGGGGGAAAA